MKQNYLPNGASITETCTWLQDETGEPWTLARLIEHGLMPWFWLDYRADADAVFAGRKQGYLAPLCFAGDAGRLFNGSREVMVTMTRNHAGEIIGLPPGSLVLPLDDLRFMRDDITQLASRFSDASAAKGEAAPVATPAITAKIGTNKKKWDDVMLRTLWAESIQPGATPTGLAKKYGVTRQRMAALIKKASENFGSRASSKKKNTWGQIVK